MRFGKKIYFPDAAGLWYFPERKKVLRLLEQKAARDCLMRISVFAWTRIEISAHL